MRIGINALYLIPGAVGGTEIYLRNLLRALGEIDSSNEYFIFTNRETGQDLAPRQANFQIVKQPIRAAFRPARILWEQIILPLGAASRHVDVLLNPGFTAPFLCGCPQVTVFHDMQHKRHPEHFRWFDRPFWNFLLFWSAHLSAGIIAVSDATREDVKRFYRLRAGKIRVATLGVEPEFFQIARTRHPEPFILSVSTLHPHKNLDGLLRGFAQFRRDRSEFKLVVAGLRGFEAANLERLRAELFLTDAVEFTGWIPREKLYDLYAHAWAFIYPSTFEGFGLPLVEALAAGIPTACSRIEPLSSIAGDAALLFDPHDDSALIAAIKRIANDQQLRTNLSSAGPQRAALFSWKTTARLTLEALLDAAQKA